MPSQKEIFIPFLPFARSFLDAPDVLYSLPKKERYEKKRRKKKKRKNYTSSKKLLTSIKEKGPLGKKSPFTRKEKG